MNSEVESSPEWLAKKERGTLLGMRVLLLICNLLGRTMARLVVRVMMLYYLAFASAARRASRQWLRVALGQEPGIREIYRHLTTFALVTLDRVFMLQGKTHLFELVPHGTEKLKAAREQRKGAILMGAHLGSFEVLRLRADGRGYDVHILSYLENSAKISAVLSALSPEMEQRVIQVGNVAGMLKARDVVEQGAMLALLGDRVGMNDRNLSVPFCGRAAPFPVGGYLLAHTLGCPVLMVYGLYKGGNRYELHCEVLAERVRLPRGNRDQALLELAERYAQRLEHHALDNPYNWFNLYDFWSPLGPAGEGSHNP